MPKAYSYLRFSTPEQMKGDSYRRQTEMAAAYAAAHGLELDESLKLEDLGKSAYRGHNAEEGALGQFLDAITQGLVPKGSFFLIENLDRLSRDHIVDAQSLFLLIIRAGITIVTLTDQRTFSRDSINANPVEMIVSILSLMRAHQESAVKADRLKAVWKTKRAKARAEHQPQSAQCPAWLTLREDRSAYDVIKPRAAVLRRIFKLAADGVGQMTIAQTLNQEGIEPWGRGKRKGKQWHRSYIAKLLSSPTCIGTFVPHVEEYVEKKLVRRALDPIEGYYPAVIKRDVYRRVQDMREGKTAPLRGRHAAGGVHNILAGLLRCPKCGASMQMVTKGPKGGPRKVVCSKARLGAGCVYRLVPYADLERTVLEHHGYLLGTIPVESDGQDLRIVVEGLESRLVDVEASIETMLDEIQRKGSPALRERLQLLEEERGAIREEIEATQKQILAHSRSLLERKIRDAGEALSADPIDRQRANAILRELLASVVVDYPGARLEFNWLHGGTSTVLYGSPWVTKKTARGRKR